MASTRAAPVAAPGAVVPPITEPRWTWRSSRTRRSGASGATSTAFMLKHRLDPKQVAGCYQRLVGTRGLAPPPLPPRAAHVLDIWALKQPHLRLVNLSQSVDRASGSHGPVMACITPSMALLGLV